MGSPQWCGHPGWRAQLSLQPLPWSLLLGREAGLLSGSAGWPAACWLPRLSRAWPAAPGIPELRLGSPLETPGGAQGNLLHPAGGCQSPCPPLKRGFPTLHQLCSHPLCLSRGRAGSRAMPGPIKPARGIKVSRMQLCLLDLTRPEGRHLQPEFTAP